MLDLYFAPTPNGWKITIMLEECGLDYRIVPVNLSQGDQFHPSFLEISPNNRMPAIVDHDAPGGTLSIFESGAILTYLAEKNGRFMPNDLHGRYDVQQWLFWQVGNLGAIAGQLSHFVNYAPGSVDAHEYAHRRFANEYDRLFAVMERSLERRAYLAGEYSIADMASWPWLVPYKRFGQDMDAYPSVRRWFDTIKERPAVSRAMEIGRDINQPTSTLTEEQRRLMFAQTGASIRQAAELWAAEEAKKEQ